MNDREGVVNKIAFKQNRKKKLKWIREKRNEHKKKKINKVGRIIYFFDVKKVKNCWSDVKRDTWLMYS